MPANRRRLKRHDAKLDGEGNGKRVTGILGKKVGMTQLFDSKGDVRPVTVLQAGPCVVTQHKSATQDGYEAAQIGLVEFVKESRLTKPSADTWRRTICRR